MRYRKSNTAILVFTRTQKHEALEKQFLRHAKNRTKQKLSRYFIHKAVKTAKESNLSPFLISSENQKGNNFGERLSHATQTVFNSGFDNIIIIGNDCPDLSSSDILSTAKKLEQGECVLGPDKNGGVFLIGISRESFCSSAFMDLSWQTEELFSELKDYFSSLGKHPYLLDFKSDINTYSDLIKFISQFPKNELADQIKHLLRNLNHEFSDLSKSLNSSIDRILSSGLRAPPVLA